MKKKKTLLEDIRSIHNIICSCRYLPIYTIFNMIVVNCLNWLVKQYKQTTGQVYSSRRKVLKLDLILYYKSIMF